MLSMNNHNNDYDIFCNSREGGKGGGVVHGCSMIELMLTLVRSPKKEAFCFYPPGFFGRC